MTKAAARTFTPEKAGQRGFSASDTASYFVRVLGERGLDFSLNRDYDGYTLFGGSERSRYTIDIREDGHLLRYSATTYTPEWSSAEESARVSEVCEVLAADNRCLTPKFSPQGVLCCEGGGRLAKPPTEKVLREILSRWESEKRQIAAAIEAAGKCGTPSGPDAVPESFADVVASHGWLEE